MQAKQAMQAMQAKQAKQAKKAKKASLSVKHLPGLIEFVAQKEGHAWLADAAPWTAVLRYRIEVIEFLQHAVHACCLRRCV